MENFNVEKVVIELTKLNEQVLNMHNIIEKYNNKVDVLNEKFYNELSNTKATANLNKWLSYAMVIGLSIAGYFIKHNDDLNMEQTEGVRELKITTVEHTKDIFNLTKQIERLQKK